MEIFKYEIIGKNTNKRRPFFDKKRGLFVCRIPGNYNWWCQARVYNEESLCYNYYLLFSIEKFCDNAKTCSRDDYGRYRLRVTDEFKEWLEKYYDVDNVNFDVNYLETIDNYDVYSVE